jgi:preprotein translocase subunit SecG
METVLLVIHLILALLLIVAVLAQRSEGGGLGIGGGGGGGGNVGGLMSVRGTANFLTRATAGLAACFMLTSLTLAIIAGNRGDSDSILDRPGASDPAKPETKEGDVPLSR